jgi:hypothetical protein
LGYPGIKERRKAVGILRFYLGRILNVEIRWDLGKGLLELEVILGTSDHGLTTLDRVGQPSEEIQAQDPD